MGRTRLAEYAEAVRDGWTEGELLRLHLHELPRSIFDLPLPAWSQERERFRETAWIVGATHEEHLVATAYAPAAFIRHGALPDPRSLDARGGERHVWVPESQPHHDALRRAVRRTGT